MHVVTSSRKSATSGVNKCCMGRNRESGYFTRCCLARVSMRFQAFSGSTVRVLCRFADPSHSTLHLSFSLFCMLVPGWLGKWISWMRAQPAAHSHRLVSSTPAGTTEATQPAQTPASNSNHDSTSWGRALPQVSMPSSSSSVEPRSQAKRPRAAAPGAGCRLAAGESARPAGRARAPHAGAAAGGVPARAVPGAARSGGASSMGSSASASACRRRFPDAARRSGAAAAHALRSAGVRLCARHTIWVRMVRASITRTRGSSANLRSTNVT